MSTTAPLPASGVSHRLTASARRLVDEPRLFVNGSWIPGEAAQPITAVDPFSERPIAEIGCASARQVDDAVMGARRAFDTGSWSRLAPADRRRLLLRGVEALDRGREALVEIVTMETGSPVSLSRTQQVDVMIEHLAWFADAAGRGPREGFENALPDRIAGTSGGAGVLIREPIGVVAALTPYNAPFVTAAWKIGGALASGSTALLLPSPRAALSSLAWIRLLCEADLPPGAVSFLCGEEEAGRRLTESTDVDMVTFTGSTGVGRSVMRQASRNLKRTVLELGGKSPNLILPGTDIEAVTAPSTLRYARNAGQACGATTRILVPRGDYDAFVAATESFLPSVAVGDPWSEETVVGPLISAGHRERVEAYVERAVSRGGTIEAGGGRPAAEHGYFLNPALIGRVDNDAEIAREELFGPVAVLIPYDHVASAVAMANDSSYGLNANVWGPEREALDVARRIRSGTVTVNGGGGGLRPDAPFGGYRHSGVGREAGEAGFLEFFEVKHLQWPAD